MDLFIDIPLNKYTYRFRRLNWREQVGLVMPKGKDPRVVILSHALDSVSDLKITSAADGYRILQHIPDQFRWRIWVIYQGRQQVDRRFTSYEMYLAPEQAVHIKRLHNEGDMPEETDLETQRLEQQFGKEEVAEARRLEQQILAQALKDRVGNNG